MRLTHGYSDNAAHIGSNKRRSPQRKQDHNTNGLSVAQRQKEARNLGECPGTGCARPTNSAAKLAVLADDDADRHHERLEPGAGLCLHKRSTPEGLGGHGPPRQPSAKEKPGQQSTYRATIARGIRISNFSLCSRALRRSSWGDGPAHLSLRSRQISRGRESG